VAARRPARGTGQEADVTAYEDETRLPAGVSAGHWTDMTGRTGCTVILVSGGAVGGVDVRGGAPGTLGTDALQPGRAVARVDAILLTGGSAFGLDAATGVMRFLEERGRGFAIGPVRVPIVAGAVIFDLLTGDPRARPGAGAGYAACEAATGRPGQGAVGAGTGATVAKAGAGQPRPGGLGIASAWAGEATVAAVLVANSVGGIWDDERHEWIAPLTGWDQGTGLFPGASTTIGAVVTDAELTREQANRVATVAHDGIARAVRPAHTLYDGDTLFCLATGTVPAPADAVEAVAADVVARAIATGVRAAQP
jgi:L-aminopeptidase/D-esterase-like protein